MKMEDMDLLREAEEVARHAWRAHGADVRRRARLILQMVRPTTTLAAMAATFPVALAAASHPEEALEEQVVAAARTYFLAAMETLMHMGATRERVMRLGYLIEARSRRLGRRYMSQVAEGARAALVLLGELPDEAQ